MKNDTVNDLCRCLQITSSSEQHKYGFKKFLKEKTKAGLAAQNSVFSPVSIWCVTLARQRAPLVADGACGIRLQSGESEGRCKNSSQPTVPPTGKHKAPRRGCTLRLFASQLMGRHWVQLQSAGSLGRGCPLHLVAENGAWDVFTSQITWSAGI